MIGTCAGSWIKVGSVAPDRFWVGFLGQSVVALSQVFVLSVPARLAAVWFGPSQVSSACSIGVFGNQVIKTKIRNNLKAVSQGLRYYYVKYILHATIIRTSVRV